MVPRTSSWGPEGFPESPDSLFFLWGFRGGGSGGDKKTGAFDRDGVRVTILAENLPIFGRNLGLILGRIFRCSAYPNSYPMWKGNREGSHKAEPPKRPQRKAGIERKRIKTGG